MGPPSGGGGAGGLRVAHAERAKKLANAIKPNIGRVRPYVLPCVLRCNKAIHVTSYNAVSPPKPSKAYIRHNSLTMARQWLPCFAARIDALKKPIKWRLFRQSKRSVTAFGDRSAHAKACLNCHGLEQARQGTRFALFGLDPLAQARALFRS
jgi:cytochrome c553